MGHIRGLLHTDRQTDDAELRGQGQGWVLQDSPRVSRVTVGPTPLARHSEVPREERHRGSPTVPRDTQGESCRTQPWPRILGPTDPALTSLKHQCRCRRCIQFKFRYP